MNSGDIVIHAYDAEIIGLLLEVVLDKSLMKSPFAVPWRYRVLWNNGKVKIHEVGTLRRIMVHKNG